MIKILVDWKNKKNFFLQEELNKHGFKSVVFDIPDFEIRDRTIKHRIVILYFKYLKLAYRTLVNSNENDIVICWNFNTAIALGYLCRLFGKKRKIVALNIIAHKKNIIFETLRRWICSPIMKMKHCYITVNSKQYVEDYARRFRVSIKKFFVLHDPVQTQRKTPYQFRDSYVFCGGEAQRDWESLFTAAEQLPEMKFVCIARRKYFDPQLSPPANVELHFDTDYDTFFHYMRNASIVAIPLKSELASGLIILLEAALMSKPIIATRTPSTSNYIIDNDHGILIDRGNPDQLRDAIKELYPNRTLQKKLADNLLAFLMEHHSHARYTSRLIEIIQAINVKKTNIKADLSVSA